MQPSDRFITYSQIASIAIGVLERTLPKSEWTHAAHFAATCWLLIQCPHMDISREMPTIIRTYNVATGVQNTDSSGYHETITQASIRAARDFMSRRPSSTLVATCNALLASPLGSPDWLFAYWTRKRLFTSEARFRWCEPDIQTLPF